MTKLCFVAFDILKSYPDIDWLEGYVLLFEKSIKQGEKELARQVYYQITVEAIRTKDNWIIKEFTDPENENHQAIKDLDLYDFSMNLLKVIPKEKYRTAPEKYEHFEFEFQSHSPKFQFRKHAYILCACCYEYVLTCDEIQNFPLENNEIYIRVTFDKALTQKEIHKRKFILEYLISGYFKKNPDLKLLLELWAKAEAAGAHFEPLGIDDLMMPQLLNEVNFKSLLTIINYRDDEHDSLIDDVISYLLKQGKFGLAFYLNAKLSTPKTRLYKAICEALRNEGDEEKEIMFITMVNESVKHEKMEND